MGDYIVEDMRRVGLHGVTGVNFTDTSKEAMEKAKCTSPYLSYDYALLAETDFPERP